MIVTVTGGARSGKSSFAERWCMKQGDSGLYVATAQAFDDEMKERIALHQQQRVESGFQWSTVEEPLHLVELLHKSAKSEELAESVVLIDCLTLWLTNVLLAAEGKPDSDQIILLEMDRLIEAVSVFQGHLVLVTNEVGSGIVPENPLGRKYRDLAGMLNRKMAQVSDQLFLVTAGIAIELKSREYQL
ncbi:adenosylcobinamide kinase/adenosylcobinamide-phosphate guanylyltransferase [Fontibacillus solani]|uniref:Adenosylcobinamide kinase n=1 Tax=Fontibacillus solani TaxID=1572857 RepID=A0A7W3XRV8_9BACL|nr:bifunctional adenosylcobinamide kinase/adenosylcobinamide-phosphate guanylyltransferase [Fontibacillus solani]MBA9085880.1 adenosylcobinamide kinase/adenosylcobinamide-phosphate guanylyltransferase [Fontibacillus solani]